MPISNRFNLPEVVVKALTTDHYTRGQSDISVTSLIDSPKIGLLQREHRDEIEQDAVDFLWSRFGTSVHNMFEDAASPTQLLRLARSPCEKPTCKTTQDHCNFT